MDFRRWVVVTASAAVGVGAAMAVGACGVRGHGDYLARELVHP